MTLQPTDTNQSASAAAPVLADASPSSIRDALEQRIRLDLLGPAGGPDEELDYREDRVRERYLVGMLAPRSTEVDAGELDELATSEPDDPEVGPADPTVPPKDTFFPNSMGMSFMVDPHAKGLLVKTEWGRYEKIASDTQKKSDGSARNVRKRQPRIGEPLVVTLADGVFGPLRPLESEPTVEIRGKMRHLPQGWVVTIFMINNQEEPDKKREEAWVFQPKMWVLDAMQPPQPIFVQRHDRTRDYSKMDPLTREETETLEMLYRRRLEFAVGHGVSVHVTSEPGAERARIVETEFMPRWEVEQQTPPTPADNPELAGIPLDMKELAEMPKADLIAGLERLAEAYSHWIEREAAKIGDPAEKLGRHVPAAERAVQRCQRARDRIHEGIDLIANDPVAEEAFRFANRAMWQQRVRTTYARKVRKKELELRASIEPLDVPENRTWRLFQLAFVLLNLPSITRFDHPDRSHKTDAVADLLWFATGGGKTEAYLGLTAYTLALRRLQRDVEGRSGDHGVGVVMRYTLRLLTLQQFQRAAALLCACETIRRADTGKWGIVPFRLGLWVGNKLTPNTLKQAAEALTQGNTGGRPTYGGTPHQLVSCPWCGHPIRSHHVRVYEAPGDIGRCVTYCGDAEGQCPFSEAQAPKEGLPVMLVDEDIYRRPPSLLIATVDKFAQMPWKGETQMLFGQVNGLCMRHGFLSPEIEDTGAHQARNSFPKTTRQPHGPLRPPDLIIQDELHLISGPLGSMVALYETAVDELCSWTVNGKRVRPKVIASTATIRRATDQVRKLFLRKLDVFPPQGTSIEDSFFAVQRPLGENTPGRRYLGICAFGRRYPAAVIRVYVALMASGQQLYDDKGRLVDPWMTLIGYFNSIRELAGTRRLVEDDIRSRLRDADLRGLAKRRIFIGAVEELTSRKSGSDIPNILERLDVVFDKEHDAQREADRLAKRKPAPRPFDVVLATNMISVGVDIDRLGLMVVAGQPKTTAEYIQATSRVGRSNQGPGLVVSLLNWARPRDLSHFETFEHYHDTFYQHVEALSVTPFSKRALDRGLSGVMVGLMRLQDEHLNDNRKAGELEDTDSTMLEAFSRIADRAQDATEDTAVGACVQPSLMIPRDDWLAGVHKHTDHGLGYKSEAQGVVALLAQPRAGGWDLFTCLNSLRDVEGTVNLILDGNPHNLRQNP